MCAWWWARHDWPQAAGHMSVLRGAHAWPRRPAPHDVRMCSDANAPCPGDRWTTRHRRRRGQRPDCKGHGCHLHLSYPASRCLPTNSLAARPRRSRRGRSVRRGTAGRARMGCDGAGRRHNLRRAGRDDGSRRHRAGHAGELLRLRPHRARRGAADDARAQWPHRCNRLGDRPGRQPGQRRLRCNQGRTSGLCPQACDRKRAARRHGELRRAWLCRYRNDGAVRRVSRRH